MSRRLASVTGLVAMVALAASAWAAPRDPGLGVEHPAATTGAVPPSGNQGFGAATAPAATSASPAVVAPSASGGSNAVAAPGFSRQELAELQDVLKEAAEFDAAGESYRATVKGIVKKEYTKRRNQTVNSYEKRIRKTEAEERVHRIAAIALFENFLRRYPNDTKWTPDVIFRLAELYFEKSHDEYLQAEDRYQKDFAAYEATLAAFKAGRRPNKPTVPVPPRNDYSETIRLHRQLIHDFPDYRLRDGAYYLLGFCLSETGHEALGNQAFLSLVCSNKYRPPLVDEAPTPVAPEPMDDALGSARRVTMDTLGGRGAEVPKVSEQVYANCTPLNPKSKFISEAWIRIGEYHFDENQLPQAIAAYRHVISLGSKKNAYFDEALYKLAWTYYRADRFTEAINNFDKLVVYSDKEEDRTGKIGSAMRPEAVQYLAISFAEDDWDGDTLPDAESGIQRIEKFYKNRTKEKHVYEVYKRLGEIYFDTNKYDEAVAVFKLMLARWPNRPGNPEIQDKVILALERQRKFDQAMDEREEFTRLFGRGTQWEKKNRDNTKALKKAREYDEQALIQAAVYHHKRGQDLKAKGLAGDVAALTMAGKEYALAARAYEKYLERFPNTKNSYEIKYSYASCLYYSQRFLEAGKVFSEVRDSNLDNRYQEDAAFSATKAYEEYISLQVQKGALPNPPLPKADQPPGSLTPMPLPDAYAKWQQALDAYRKTQPHSAKTPRLTYKAAEISYRFLNFDDARKRFSSIYDQYCKTPMATTAGQAVLVTYQLTKNMDKMEEWAIKLKSGKCGVGGAEGKKIAEEARMLHLGIRFKKADLLMKKGKWEVAAKAYLALVDSDPTGSDADKALNNAAVCYEKDKRFESATRIYERVWQQYPKSQYAGNAVWRTALNYQRIFEFDKAVNNFLILADSDRFKNSPNRLDSIYNAAVILENDQAYGRAARLFVRYADAKGITKEAADAYFRAGLIYAKMNNTEAMNRIFREFPKRYAGVEGQEPRIVQGIFEIAKAADKRGDWRTARKYYRMTQAEFTMRGLQPASDAAEYAANAAFLLVEYKLKSFLKSTIKGALRRVPPKQKRMARQALALKRDYEKVLAFKRIRWSLAAMFRFGTIYEHFARTMDAAYRSAPIPRQVKRLGDEAIDIYRGQVDQLLTQQVDPIVAQAKAFYVACVNKAKEVGVSNKYTEDAMRKLSTFDPIKYPLLKRAKVEFSIE